MRRTGMKETRRGNRVEDRKQNRKMEGKWKKKDRKGCIEPTRWTNSFKRTVLSQEFKVIPPTIKKFKLQRCLCLDTSVGIGSK